MGFRLPTHRVDATPVYIDWELDGAWKKAELDAEAAEIAELNKDRPKAERIMIGDHPVTKYRFGETRYDIDAPVMWRGKSRQASEWVGEGAVRFILRRLRWDRWYECQSLASWTQRSVLACQLGLRRVDGLEALEVDEDLERRTSEEMQRLFDADPMLPIRIGAAVLAASKPLDDGEKKS